MSDRWIASLRESLYDLFRISDKSIYLVGTQDMLLRSILVYLDKIVPALRKKITKVLKLSLG